MSPVHITAQCSLSCADCSGTIFAYGQTGSGKTHTMFGGEEPGELLRVQKHPPSIVHHLAGTEGLIPKMAEDLFNRVAQIEHSYTEDPKPTATKTVKVELSFFEIYNETLNDLIGTGRDLRVREAKKSGTYVEGLAKVSMSINCALKYDVWIASYIGLCEHSVGQITVDSAADVMELIEIGTERRHVAATAMNERSSRSHSVIQFQVLCTLHLKPANLY